MLFFYKYHIITDEQEKIKMKNSNDRSQYNDLKEYIKSKKTIIVQSADRINLNDFDISNINLIIAKDVTDKKKATKAYIRVKTHTVSQ